MGKKYIVIVLLMTGFIHQATPADLGRAYSYYLLKDYDSSIVYYKKALQENDHEIHACYGLMNCYIALGRYDTAVTIGTNAFSIDTTFDLYNKILYALALDGKVKSVTELYPQALSVKDENIDSVNQQKELMNTIGYGFYYAEKYRQARKWFSQAISLYPHAEDFSTAIQLTNIGIKNLNKQQVNLGSGVIHYSDDADYKNGWFVTPSASLLHKNRHRFTMEYARTEISFNKLSFTIPADTLYYGITVYDSVEVVSPDETHPIDTVIFINGSGILDTLYYPYETVLIDSPDDTTGFDKFDTVYIDPYSGIYTPEKLTQNDFYLSYENYERLFKNTRLLLGSRYTSSNMLYSNTVISFFLSHFTKIKKFSTGAFYCFSSAESHVYVQISPTIFFRAEHFESGVNLHCIQKINSEIEPDSLFPERQFAFDINMNVITPHVRVNSCVMGGKRMFLNEAEGKVLHNALSTYKVGALGSIELTPFPFPLTVYYLVKFSQYSDYSSLVNMGGIFLQW